MTTFDRFSDELNAAYLAGVLSMESLAELNVVCDEYDVYEKGLTPGSY